MRGISDWSDTVIQRKTNKTGKANKGSSLATMAVSPTKIWNSKISWRIALSVFLTILVVQGGIMFATFKQQEAIILNDIRELGRSIIAPAIINVADMLASPISNEQAERMTSTTIVKGLSVYSMDLRLLGTYGEPVSMVMLDKDSLSRTYRSGSGDSYEVVYRSNDLRRPYTIVARLDSRKVSPALLDYVNQTVAIMLLMSAFVTVVLMISLSKWLLEPMLFMRDNLLAAAENPENPDIKESPFDSQDEIGGAIHMAQSLIQQNADNIRQIKSAAEDKIHKLAYYDTLTGLPNRTLFLQRLTEQARAANDDDESRTKRFAVIAMDLDHFKDINDSMGHNIGDAILRGVGKRLRAALPENAVVARSGEDEFAITMPLSTDINSARDLGNKVANVIRAEPFKVFNESFQVRASIGVSTFPDDAIDPDQVLKNADIALNRAKEEGRDTVKEYSEDFDRAVQQRFQMLRDLRDAMEAKELQLFFQPQFNLLDGKIIGAEALLRWFKKDNSKNGGSFISPAEFVPIAEQSGLIVPIGEWVMRHSCEVAAAWAREGFDLRVAVNVSGAQFYQSDLVNYVSQCLRETGLKPSNLEIEVTESVFMDDIQHTIGTLQQLHALGVELAIDDFGTGYSSLSYLRQFPIDRLKIDQSFIRNALNNQDDAAIARTIVRLGHSLNLKVIAEGVETKEHETFLLEEKCDEVQGFRYSKPIPLPEFNKFISGYKGSLNAFDK
jgi:diguanylate cyclase (GGDEF)-like protein